MPEGDTVHRTARRLQAALGAREIELARAPSSRSPLHLRAGELEGRVLERVEARGKHLLAYFSDELAVHSHLGMNGRWLIRPEGPPPAGKPWLTLASGATVAAQTAGKLLRLGPAARIRGDLALARLGPDPLAPGFDSAAAARRLREAGGEREVGDALLDQRVIAGIGNVIRNEACFASGVSPWRRLRDVTAAEAERLVVESERIMRVSLERGRRPRLIYGARGRCPRCGGQVNVRGQGDANRVTYWCPRCQR